MFDYEKIRTLNNLEQDVYTYISQHLEEVNKLKIRELANSIHVSTATILRFCKKMGYRGFSDFKWTLNAYLEKAPPVETDGYQNNLRPLSNFIAHAQATDFQKQVANLSTYLQKFDTIFFFGVSTNATLAEYGTRYFSSIGKPTYIIGDPYQTLQPSQYKNAALLALTQSGESREVIQQVELFKRHQAGTSVITTSPQSTVATLSETKLCYNFPKTILTEGSDKTTTNIEISSQVPLILILEMIGQQVQAQLKKEKPIRNTPQE